MSRETQSSFNQDFDKNRVNQSEHRRKDRCSFEKVSSQTFSCRRFTAALRFRIAGCSENCRFDFHKARAPTSMLVDIFSSDHLLFGQVV
jgi:hypothetical protein